MEHVIASQIMNHDEENDILHPLQHGFRRGRSCETQLIEFIDDLSSNLQGNQQTDVLVMYFAKAFDKVCHSLLVHKLYHYGIRGKVNTWITGSPTGNRSWGPASSFTTSTTYLQNFTHLCIYSPMIPLLTW